MKNVPEEGASVKKFDVDAEKKLSEGVTDAYEVELVARLRRACAYEATAGRKGIWMPDAREIWTLRPAQDALKDILELLKAEGIVLQSDQLRRLIDAECAVDVVWRDGLLLPAGIYEHNGMRWLVRRGMPLWVEGNPERMDDPKLRDKVTASNAYTTAFSGVLGGVQSQMLDAYFAGYRANKREFGATLNVTRDLPALAIIGEQGCGKTLLVKRLFPHIVGTEGVDFGRYATGRTDFTSHIESHGLLLMDDSLVELSTRDRQEFTKRLKAMLYGACHEIHLKGLNPISLKLPHAIVICSNTDPASLRALPLLIGKDKDKMLVLQAVGQLPHNETAAEKAKWNARFEDPQEIQDYVDFLDWLSLHMERHPEQHKAYYSERQYVKGGCPQEKLRKLIASVSPEGVVEQALRSAIDEMRAISASGKPVSCDPERMRICDALDAIQKYALRTYREEFNRACLSSAARKRALSDWMESKKIGDGERDNHLNSSVWNFAQLVKEEEETEKAQTVK